LFNVRNIREGCTFSGIYVVVYFLC